MGTPWSDLESKYSTKGNFTEGEAQWGTQLEALCKTIRDTEAQRDKANEQLEKMIDELQIEATM